MFDIPELDDAVCQRLRRNDLVQCAQVCRKWHEMAIPYLWRDLSWIAKYSSSSSQQRDSFCRLVLEGYLHERQRQTLEEEGRRLEPPSQEQPSSPPLSTLAKYGRWVQRLPHPTDLRFLLCIVSPPTHGTNEIELMRHLYQHCPAMRVPSFAMMHVNDPDDYLELISEFVLPCTQDLVAECSDLVRGCKGIIGRLDRCSDKLEELTIITKKGLGGDMEEYSAQEETPWTNLKRLKIHDFDEKWYPESFCSWLWKRCSQAEMLMVMGPDRITERTVEAMSKHMSNLHRIQLNGGYYNGQAKNVALLLSGLCKGWKAVKLENLRSFEEGTREALARHFDTLEELVVLNCPEWTMYDIVKVLTFSPRLHTLNIDINISQSPDTMNANVFIDLDHHTGLHKAWSCEATLKELTITISGVPGPYSERGLEIHSQVYERLARLSNLEILRLGGALYYDEGQEMIKQSCLQMSLESGLGKLAGLKSLKLLDVSFLRSKIGVKEVQWMMEHWPRLRTICGLREEWLEQHCPGIKFE